MDTLAVQKHREWRGKVETKVKCPVTTEEELALAYTPGVAEACMEIYREPSQSFDLTGRANTVAVGQHRSGSGHARHGRQMRLVQDVRQRGRRPHLFENDGYGRDNSHGKVSGRQFWRYQFGRYFGSEMF